MVDKLTLDQLLANFIMNTPETTEKRLKELHPQMSDLQTMNELTGLRFFVVDMVLYLKLKNNLDFKNKLFHAIRDNIRSSLEKRVGKEKAELYDEFLSNRRTEYAIVLNDDTERLAHVFAQFAINVGADDNVNLMAEVAEIFKEYMKEVIEIINNRLLSLSLSLSDEEIASSNEEASPFVPSRVKKAKIMAYLVALIGIYTCYRFFISDDTGIDPTILGLISVVVTFRQVTTIHALGTVGMVQKTGSNITASLFIVVLLIVSLFY